MNRYLIGLLLAGGMAWSANRAWGEDDAVFIHHSVGYQWLDNSLNAALLGKSYISQRNDIFNSTDVPPDAGRPDSLAPAPGDSTDMRHWVYWFNDYLGAIKSQGTQAGHVNRIILFKSCFTNSDMESDGTEPGDPFSSQNLANYKAVYRHPAGKGNSYLNGGNAYKPLEDIFAANPGTLFIPITAPPLNYTGTNDANAHRARVFNNWLKTDWLSSYNAEHPTLRNVAVFDLFDALAYADNDPLHPNRLRAEYNGETGDGHPNAAGYAHATDLFATLPGDFLDEAWAGYAPPVPEPSALGLLTILAAGTIRRRRAR